MAQELKPCPFCGGKAELRTRVLERERKDEPLYSFVCCTSCFASGPNFHYKDIDRTGINPTDEAAKAWNKRAGKETMQNIDVLRQMSIDELTRFLVNNGAETPLDFCQGCEKYSGEDCDCGPCEYNDEVKAWKQWLGREVKDEENNSDIDDDCHDADADRREGGEHTEPGGSK